MCSGFGIYVVHTSCGLFWAIYFRTRIKSGEGVTAVFNNTRTLKFKSEQTFEFFAAVNHLSRPLGNQKFILTS